MKGIYFLQILRNTLHFPKKKSKRKCKNRIDMGICILRMKALKKCKYTNIYITYVYAYINIELDFYLPNTVCSTNILCQIP